MLFPTLLFGACTHSFRERIKHFAVCILDTVLLTQLGELDKYLDIKWKKCQVESKSLGEKGCCFKGYTGNGLLKSGCEPLQVGKFLRHVVLRDKSSK